MHSRAWVVLTIISTSLIQILLPVECFPGDIIVALPGQPRVNFHQFSGFVAVTPDLDRALFYYFVEAESDPASKPLVLWLNGGPGCSSVGLGAFYTNGPFKPNGRALIKNEYIWNREANMLYVESPAGVGFSHSTNNSLYDSVNDEITAQDNLAFLQNWLLRYPQYMNSDLYLTGESYVGHYVPQLAQLILKSNMTLKLKGIAMGNPLLEFGTDFNGEDEYFWSHGLISDASYKLLTSVCNTSQLLSQGFRGNLSEACSGVNTAVSKELSLSIDINNVLADVCVRTTQSQFQHLNHQLGSRFQLLSSRYSQSEAAGGQEKFMRDDGGKDACQGQKIVPYFNRKDVQGALHAKLVGVPQWTPCSSVLNYDLKNLEIPTVQLLGSLVKSGIPAIIYSGDQDAIIPFIGSRTLIDGLAKDLGLNVTVPYRAWFEGKQVAGNTQAYGNLTFATVRGGGHSTPADQRERSLALFRAFLAGKPLPEA